MNKNDVFDPDMHNEINSLSAGYVKAIKEFKADQADNEDLREHGSGIFTDEEPNYSNRRMDLSAVNSPVRSKTLKKVIHREVEYEEETKDHNRNVNSIMSMGAQPAHLYGLITADLPVDNGKKPWSPFTLVVPVDIFAINDFMKLSGYGQQSGERGGRRLDMWLGWSKEPPKGRRCSLRT